MLKQIEQFKPEIPGVGANAPDGMDEDFKKVLTKLISEVDQSQKDADVSLQQLAKGETNSIQDVVLKMEEADVSFKMMLEIRNKLLQAYKELISAQA